MFLVQWHAVASVERRRPDVGGAQVVCWIDADDVDDAVARARAEIVDEGFVPDPGYEVYVVTREDYLEDLEGLEYFDQAVIDTEVCVFYCYPVDDVEP